MKRFSVSIPLFSVRHHGGVRIILQLANSLVSKGHRVTIVTPQDRFAPIYPIDPRVNIKFLSKVGGSSKINALKTMAEMAVRIPPADFLLGNFFATLLAMWAAEKLGKGRAIYFVQDSEEPLYFQKRLIDWLLRKGVYLSFNLKKVPTIVTTKWGAAEIIKRYGPRPLSIINLGLPDGLFFQDIEEKDRGAAKAILYFPRKHPVKDLDTFLAALDLVLAHRADFDLWLVSKEEESLCRFHRYCNDLRISVLSPTDDHVLRKIYSAAYILVNSSVIEGFCLPILEGMACGLPAVFTESGGPSEYALDGYNSLIVPAKSPGPLAQAIMKILDDEELRNNLSANSLRTADNFKFSATASQFETFLMDICNDC